MLNGHSGSKLEIIEQGNKLVLRKFSINSMRLVLQAEKQERYWGIIINESELAPFFRVPEIYKTTLGYVDMQFCNGISLLDVIAEKDISVLDIILDHIFKLLQWEFNISKQNWLNNGVLENKVADLRSKIQGGKIYDILMDVEANLVGVEVCTGICHGDLTFSNMLFSDKIVLLDFLDSFIETPIIDLTKLMQEVRLRWSLVTNSDGRDVTKLNIGYDYLEEKFEPRLDKFIKDNALYPQTVYFFYLLTLIRVLPYCKSEKIYNIILKEIYYKGGY